MSAGCAGGVTFGFHTGLQVMAFVFCVTALVPWRSALRTCWEGIEKRASLMQGAPDCRPPLPGFSRSGRCTQVVQEAPGSMLVPGLVPSTRLHTESGRLGLVACLGGSNRQSWQHLSVPIHRCAGGVSLSAPISHVRAWHLSMSPNTWLLARS